MEFWKSLIIQKEIKKLPANPFAFGLKTNGDWNSLENLKFYIQKSQWKIDVLPIWGGGGHVAPGLVGTFEFGGWGCIHPCINLKNVVEFKQH